MQLLPHVEVCAAPKVVPKSASGSLWGILRRCDAKVTEQHVFVRHADQMLPRRSLQVSDASGGTEKNSNIFSLQTIGPL